MEGQGGQWQVWKHNTTDVDEFAENSDAICDAPESYYEDLLKVQKVSLAVNFHHYIVEKKTFICFENYAHSMNSLAKEDISAFFKIDGGRVYFTALTKQLITKLMLGLKKLVKLKVSSRIPSDPSDIVFLGREMLHTMDLRFVLKVNADPSRSDVKLHALLSAWVNGNTDHSDGLAPVELDFIHSITRDKFNCVLLHPALWLPGTARRYFIEGFIEFSKIRKRDAVAADMFPAEVKTKYEKWRGNVLKDPDLKLILQESEKERKYGEGVEELFRFHRNAFLHPYDCSKEDSNSVIKAKIKLTTEILEKKLAAAFPGFFLDFYRCTQAQFKFIDRALKLLGVVPIGEEEKIENDNEDPPAGDS